MDFSKNKYAIFSFFGIIIFIILAIQVYLGLSITYFDSAFNSWLISNNLSIWNASLVIAYIFGTPGFVLLCILLAVISAFRGKNSHTLFILGTMLLTGGIGYIMKIIIHRARPESIILETDFSFPSGHSLYSFVLISIIFYLFFSEIKNIRNKRIAAVSLSLLVFAVGFSRLYLHVHWFSDILGGWALGIFLFSLAAFVHEKYKRLDKKNIGF